MLLNVKLQTLNGNIEIGFKYMSSVDFLATEMRFGNETAADAAAVVILLWKTLPHLSLPLCVRFFFCS